MWRPMLKAGGDACGSPSQLQLGPWPMLTRGKGQQPLSSYHHQSTRPKVSYHVLTVFSQSPSSLPWNLRDAFLCLVVGTAMHARSNASRLSALAFRLMQMYVVLFYEPH